MCIRDRPKAVDDQLNVSTDSNDEADSSDNVPFDDTRNSTDNTLTGSTERVALTQPWRGNDRQATIRNHYRFRPQSASNENSDYSRQEKNKGMDVTDTLNKHAYGKKIEENVRTKSEGKISGQSSRNQDERENIKLRQQISEEFHVELPPLEKQDTAETRVSEAPCLLYTSRCV